MKITLRKRDSVTSSVLFLFNLLGEYKNGYSINLSHLMEFMKYFHKSEASIRTGLSRMVKANILINKREHNEIIYQLTEEGVQNIRQWNKSLAKFYKRYELRQADWNHQWCFLTILDFNKSEYNNLFILEELEGCGLREVNNNLWITPYNIDDEILTLLKNHKFNYLKGLGTFETNMNLNDFLRDTFNLETIRRRYIEFINKVKEINNQRNVPNGNLLPILFEVGWDFYDIVTSDAVLPKELMKDWEEDQAVREMKAVRSELYKKISDFFKENNL